MMTKNDNLWVKNDQKLVEQWDIMNNGEIPENLTINDIRNQYVWNCKNNHRIKVAVKTWARGECRLCKKLNDENRLSLRCQNIDFYYCREHNHPLTPADISIKSHQKICMYCDKCQQHHQIEVRKLLRYDDEKYKCSYCDNKIFHSRVNSIAIKAPHLIKFFDKDKNSENADSINIAGKKRIWWRCKNGHSFQLKTASMMNNPKCRICLKEKLNPISGNVTIFDNTIKNYWNYSKNIGIPEAYLPHSNYKAEFYCNECHNSWSTYIFKQSKLGNCPYCCNRIIIVGFNDPETRFPHIKEYWDEKSNNKKIENCLITDKIYLKCNRGHSYVKTINDVRGSIEKSCPKCFPSGISRLEKNVLDFICKNYDGIIKENDRKILLGKELDIYLPDLNLAIEVNGDFWHGDEWMQKTQNKSSYEHHKEKFDSCKELGITLLYVWEDQWNTNNTITRKLLLDAINGIMVHPLLQSLTVEVFKKLRTKF